MGTWVFDHNARFPASVVTAASGQTETSTRPCGMSALPPTTDIVRPHAQVRSVPILLQKSKIQRPQKSRKCRFLDNFAAVMLSAANMKTGGRFAANNQVPHVARRKTHQRL